MHPSLFLAALCLGIASAAPQVDPNLDAQWFQWKAAHGKIYNVDEEGWRRAVWETNLKMIEQHNREYNQGKHSFTMAMNGFGDMKTNDEFRHTMNGLKIQKGSVSISNLYPGCEHVSVRSRSMMFEPGLTRGTLEVVVAPPQHPHCAADDQSTKAIDIQNAYLNEQTTACPLAT